MGVFSKLFCAIGRLFGRRPMPLVRPIESGQAVGPQNDPHTHVIEIETSFQGTTIPGTSLQIGVMDKVLESESNGLIRLQEHIGKQFGCGNFVFQTTPNGTVPGLGGQCPFCLSEAMLALRSGLISAIQVHSLSLYCTNCASRCDACGKNMCRRHTIQSADSNGQVIRLCSDCHKAIQQNHMFQTALSIILGPFIGYPNTNAELAKRNPDVR
jgi:hypothetical protein